MNYTDEKISACYVRLLEEKAKKQKDAIDKKVQNFEFELDRRSDSFKKIVMEETQKQLDSISHNTEMFKKQVREEAELKKKLIDENLAERQVNIILTMEEVKQLILMLNA